MGLASILRMLGGIPGRLNEAQYEHSPEYRERMAQLDLGEDLGEADVPTGDLEPMGEKRTGRLSKFGKFTKGAMPEMLRGALVAAANPTPGKVGTAADIFGAIGAVSEDKNNRDMLSYKIGRQLEQDQMDRRLNEAKARDYEAQADLNQWRTQQTVAGRGAKPEKPTKSQQVDEQVALFRRVMKREPNERELQTMLGTHGPQYDVRGEETVWAQLLQKATTPEERNAILEQQAAAERKKASAKSAGTAEGKAPFMRPFAFNTDAGAKLVRPSFMNGKLSGVEEQDVAFNPRKAAPRKATASDEKLSREKTISGIVNRILKEDSSGKPENALRNLQQFYENDPEVQQYKAEVMARLQKLVQGQGTSAKAEQSIDLFDRAKARKQGKATPSKAEDLRSKYNY